MKKVLSFFLMLFLSTTMWGANKTLYFFPNSNWSEGNAKFAVYYFNDANQTNGWSQFMTSVAGETNLYTTTIPDGYPTVIFCRINGTASAPGWSEGVKWNQSANLLLPTDGKNLFVLADGWDDMSGMWQTFSSGISANLKSNSLSVPAEAPDVMLQAFYWDSYTDKGYGDTKWATLINQADELGTYFDLVWLPPCSQSSGGTGYIPKDYSNLNSDWGSESELKSLIGKLHNKGSKVVADIVVNHITGNSGWCSFATMDFGSYGKFYPESSWICNTDEMNAESIAGDCQGKATGAADVGYDGQANYTAARDWDHQNPYVQAMCRAYLQWLKNEVGFDGWRYDYGKGFLHKYINDYNSAAGAYMSVVEYWDGNKDVLIDRINDAKENDMAFDFSTKYNALNDGIAASNYSKCQGAGLLGAGKSKYAVTFVDNHDTFQRENDSGEFGGHNNSMSSDLTNRLLQANAYILCMPGIPCVFYPHWAKHKEAIKPMIEARRLTGVHSESTVKDEQVEQGGYQATIVGKNGYIVLQLGNKASGNIANCTKHASGSGYAIWISTNTPVEHTYTVAGNSDDIFGTAWTPSLEANDMVKQDDGSYKWEKTDLALAAGTIEFKVCEDHAWTTAYPAQDYQLNISAAGTYTITITFNASTKAITATATKTSGSGSGEQQTTTKFYITGNAALIGDLAWNPAAIAVEEDSYTIDNLPAGNGYQLKITTDGTWNTAKGYYDLTTTAEGLSTDNDGNVCFSLSKAGSVTVTYTGSVFKVEVKLAEDSGSGDDPQPGEIPVVKLAGSLTSWEEPVLMVTAEDKLSANLKLNLGIDHYQLKVISDGNWLSKDGGDDLYTMHRDWNHVDHLDLINTGDNIKLITDVEGEYVFTWTFADSTLVVTFPETEGGDEPGGDDPQPTPAKFYITGDSALVVDAGAGIDKKWNPAAIKSEKDTFELDLKADQYYVLKLTLNGTWEGENNVKGFNELTEEIEGLDDVSDDHNIGFKLSEAGKVQVIYTVKDNKTIFKLVGKFVTEGSGSGDDPEPGEIPVVKLAGSLTSWEEPVLMVTAEDKLSANLKLNLGIDHYQLKVISDGNWLSKDGGDDLYTMHRDWNHVDHLDLINTGDNIKLITDVEGEYVFTWTFADSTLVVTFPEAEGGDEPGGDDPQPTPAKFYITGDSALVVDAGAGIDKKWNPAAIKSEKDTFELDLKADQYYVLKLTLNGTWEGENNVKGFNELTEEIEGLDDVSDDHNIGFKLSEAGKVQVIYTIKDNKTIFKLVGKFVTEGSGSGDDPQPTIIYYMKNNWNGGEDWTWKEMAAAENNTFKLEKVVFGGTGVNYNTAENDEGAEWVEVADFAGDEIGALDTVTFILDLAAEKKVKAILLGKYQEEQGGGDDPQPVDSVTVYFVNTLDWTKVNAFVWAEKALIEWPGEEMKKEVEKIQDFDVYSYKFPETYVNIIFNTGSGEKDVQTIDLQREVDKPYFVIKGQNEAGKFQGEWYAKNDVPASGSGSGDLPITKFYITGNDVLVGESKAWNAAAIAVTEDSYTFENLAAGKEYKMKITTDGTWTTEKTFSDLTTTAEGLTTDDDGNICFSLSEAGDVKVTYTENEFKLEGKFVVPEPAPDVEDGYYLMGTFNDWKPAEEYLFKENSQNPGEYYLNITLKVNDELKVAKVVNGKADPWYPAGDDNNYVVDADHAGAKTIYFQPDYKEAWDAFGGYIYIEANKPTDIDAQLNADKATKLFHNGQLLIIRGTRTYTVMGQLVQ